jgi:broad-specificity NMP kinase
MHIGVAKRSRDEFTINTSLLKNRIDTRGKIVAGHLLAYVTPNKDLDLIVVLRTSPEILRKRYLARKYSEEKIRENIEAEIIGLISAECAAVYDRKKIAEFDTSGTRPATIVRKIMNIIEGKEPPDFGSIDWLYGLSASSLEQALRGKCNRLNRPKRITRFANPKARKSRYYSDTR